MAKWNKGKADPSKINGGNQFTSDDILAVDELNAMVNNSFYGVDFVEAMADQPDVSDIANTGTPNVSLVSNIKNGKEFKRFKFSNLRGEKGLQGDKGETGDKGEKGDKGDPNTLTIGSVTSGTTASATITGTAPNQVLNLVLPKGEKGDKGETGGKKYMHNIHVMSNGEVSVCFSLITQSSSAYSGSEIISVLNSKGYTTYARMCPASGAYIENSALGVVSGIYKDTSNNTSIIAHHSLSSGNQYGAVLTLSKYTVYDFVVEI